MKIGVDSERKLRGVESEAYQRVKVGLKTHMFTRVLTYHLYRRGLHIDTWSSPHDLRCELTL